MLLPLLINLGMFGDSEIVVPPTVIDPGTAIANPNAVLYASQYHICDRTGFKVPAGMLRKEWTGAMVRPQSWERRHPQDFIRARPEHHKGSPRPEQTDTFITTEVDAEDL